MDTSVVVNHAAQAPQPDPWFRTRSPEEAIHLGETAFYPHRLGLLGPSNSFGLTQRVTCVGPITVGDITYETDVALNFDETCASYHVCVPRKGWLESRHRGQQLTSTPALAAIYRPDAEMAVTRWPAGSRHLAVKIDQVAVDRALETLVDDPLDLPIAFDAALPLNAGAAQDWVRLVLMVLLHHRGTRRPQPQSAAHTLKSPRNIYGEISWPNAISTSTAGPRIAAAGRRRDRRFGSSARHMRADTSPDPAEGRGAPHILCRGVLLSPQDIAILSGRPRVTTAAPEALLAPVR
ncbi:MAG: putative AraC-family transcriptional regulator [Mycobacterium sp.]|nr:putative AraC-family transcriptional regulator [Mycobacterium sp.]